MVRLENVTKRYTPGGDVLKQVSLDLDAGEMAFLTGHSGAGKSTLLKLIALIERPTRGQLNRNVTKISNRSIPMLRRKMGIVFQDHQLLHDRNIFENVALPLKISGFHPRDISRRARAALDKVGLLSREKSAPIALSGGEQQRVGIARAIVHKPALLLADEPTGNLDPDLSLEIMQLFSSFNQVGTTVLIASHDIVLINKMNKRIIELHHGRCVA
jgi:cell division transport system ATP-binding protein